MGTLARLAVVSALVASAACGGGNSTVSSGTPTSPSPSPGGDATVACGALGQTVGRTVSIVNGAECSSAQSAVVLLNIRNQLGDAIGACSGTIIAARSILTAAHCVDQDAALVRVWLGSGAEIVADSFTLHPTYVQNPSTGLDVAIVTMDQDLPRNPRSILTSREATVGESAVIAGWGRDQSSIPSTLRAGTTTISAVDSIYVQTLFSQTASSICLGDSGGPIFLNQGGVWTIAGVSSAASVVTCNQGANFYVKIRHPDVTSFIVDRVPQVGRR
jgi:hypothetical protein